ncbi:RloB-like protein [Murinocardiopsis flavida]|uniref:RloB-like protein n=2 Tax=Murinocardiopsis flavida TaxID=645275 RepID=A0A2P8DUW6_9ACTN|nr:RloB-like protein [Murinocardiopsis flavida]
MRVLKAAIDFNSRDTDGYDEVWVVVDVDDHATLDEALQKGRQADIPIVVSNPCFEIWLIWHYEDCRAHQTTSAAIECLTKHRHTEKQIPNTFPYGAYEEA